MQDGGIPHPALETSARERQLFPDLPEVGLVCSYGTRSVRRARQIVNRDATPTLLVGESMGEDATPD
jgi:hypothetical protein